jgi:hypothetical protein
MKNSSQQHETVNLADALRGDLLTFTPDPSVSTRQLIVELRPEIGTALRNGARWQDIAAIFEVRGVKVSAETVRQYWRAANPSKQTRGLRGRKQKIENARAQDEVPLAPVSATEPSVLSQREPAEFGLTEATAAGRPVIARRLT